MCFRRSLVLGSLALAGAFTCTPAQAACTVTTTPVVFGAYDALNATPKDGVGVVDTSCTVNTSIAARLGPGNGTVMARKMMNGAHSLNYNVYIDAARTNVWGGESAGFTNFGSGKRMIMTVYGRIPAGQAKPGGTYSDVLVVTVVY